MVALTRAWPVVALLTAACSSTNSASPSTPAATALVGSVTDAIGDPVLLPVLRNGVTITPVVAVLPDLVAATVTVFGGSLATIISFAPGTLVEADTSVCLMLDVDENPATGAVSSDPNLGYDYSACAVNPARSMIGQVSRLGGGTATGIGSFGASFLGANQIAFSLPVAMLGNDDGRMAFKVQVIKYVDDPVVFNTSPIDWMPDIGRPAGLIR